MVVKKITELFLHKNKNLKLKHKPLPEYKVMMSREIDPASVDFENDMVQLMPRNGKEWFISYWYEIKN